MMSKYLVLRARHPLTSAQAERMRERWGRALACGAQRPRVLVFGGPIEAIKVLRLSQPVKPAGHSCFAGDCPICKNDL